MDGPQSWTTSRHPNDITFPMSWTLTKSTWQVNLALSLIGAFHSRTDRQTALAGQWEASSLADCYESWRIECLSVTSEYWLCSTAKARQPARFLKGWPAYSVLHHSWGTVTQPPLSLVLRRTSKLASVPFWGPSRIKVARRAGASEKESHDLGNKLGAESGWIARNSGESPRNI